MWKTRWLALLAVCACTDAWGGVFNRFSPEMLDNMGYGGANGNGGGYGNRYPYGKLSEEPFENLQPGVGNRLDELIAEEAAECYDSVCWDNDGCCPGFTCYTFNGVEGRCMPGFIGKKMGEVCSRDSQCDAGLLCEEAVPGEAHVCRPPSGGHKQYNQDCEVSSQCDISRGLCCVMQRRHRQKPRKACSYFKDPLVCIGPVATDMIQGHVEHTAGEKRLGFYKRLH